MPNLFIGWASVAKDASAAAEGKTRKPHPSSRTGLSKSPANAESNGTVQPQEHDYQQLEKFAELVKAAK